MFFKNLARSFRKIALPSHGKLYNPVSKSLYSTQSQNLTVDVDDTGVALVSMKRPPVNSLNLEFIQEFSQTIKDLENSRKCHGFILTSSIPKIFSAGLDIMEMYQPKPDRLKNFWFALQQLWIDLYVSKLASVAAITGHSPAGGCLLALTCDYRIMVHPHFTIGLNETHLGIVAPFWFQDSFVNTIGQREAEIGMSLGKLYSSEEALKIRLVDQTVPSTEEALQAARTEIKKWLKIPNRARQATKLQLRGPIVENLVNKRDRDIESFVTFVSLETTQKSLGIYLESLKKKKG